MIIPDENIDVRSVATSMTPAIMFLTVSITYSLKRVSKNQGSLGGASGSTLTGAGG